MVRIITYSHDWAEVECSGRGKKKRCEINLRNDGLHKPTEHKEELKAIQEMKWDEFRKMYKGCRA